MPIAKPPIVMIEPCVRAALLEDLGIGGDVTTTALVPAELFSSAALVARQPGTLAGLDAAILAFRLMDPSVEVRVLRDDGSKIAPHEVIATVTGPARAILTAERVALNFLCHLSGIASATASMVEAAQGYCAQICCTRKTLPGLRTLQKYAVRVGGGVNHRFGLSDGVLVKDNHIAVAGGICAAVERVRANVGHMIKIEVEIDELSQLAEALHSGADAVLLDNMGVANLRQAVELVGGRMITEASGRITPSMVREVAATGVELISAGWLTHSVVALDIGLDWDAPRAV